MSGRPLERYQCVSRPGSCKFEWNCGPLCACHAPKTGSEQCVKDMAEAERRQVRWRKARGYDG